MDEEEAFRNYLGIYRAPPGQEGPKAGWWCKGDAVRADRWDPQRQGYKQMDCPHDQCEWRQEAFGPDKSMALCKPHLTLLAQFRWKDDKDLPNLIFQFDSDSWNTLANLKAMFDYVRTVSSGLGVERCPVFHLPFTMAVRETVKGKRRFPQVHFSFDGDVQQWLRAALQMGARRASGLPTIDQAALPLGEAPESGLDEEEYRAAREAALATTYKPANER
jgi:hypothetical protein